MKSAYETAYELKFEDLIAGFRLFHKACTKTARTLKAFRIIAILCLVSLAYMAITQPDTITSPALIGPSVGAIWILVGLPWQQKQQLKKSWKKLTVPPAETLPVRLQFDDEQISFQHPGKSEARFFWSGIVGAFEDDSYLLLIVADRMFYYIPKRVLSPELLAALKSVAPMGKEYTC